MVVPHLTFDGTQGKLEDFLLRIETHFHFHPARFATEADKVLYTAAFLVGTAAKAFEPHVRKWLDSKDRVVPTETGQIFGSFDLFKTKLHSLYGVLDKPAVAEQQIRCLVQTGSVSIYAAEFLQWAAYLDWNDAALRSQFTVGLNELIRSELTKASKYDDLPGLIIAARMIDERVSVAKAHLQRAPVNANNRAWTRCYYCRGFGHIARFCPDR